jgi:putative secretion ATPase (PEP-CTERM system associated)
MYERFLNLNTKPFELVPNPDFLFFSKSHKKAMTYLDYGISEKIGFILLTGEVGSGKTTMMRNLIKRLNGNVTLSKVFNTRVSSEQLISMINEDFGLDVAGKDKITLLRELNDFLIEQYADKRQPILIIDEAQNLTPELLEEVRMLSNLETARCKLLQIILVGQPELRRTLAQPELRQLRQRISISCHILPLTREETEEYILHRLEIAGNREAAIFSDEALDAIYKFSKGIPRLVNIVCDFLLLSAFVEDTRDIRMDLVKEVIGDLATENRYWQDEAPENYASDNDNVLKEMIGRISNIEEELSKTHITRNEKAEIFERLSASENSLNRFIETTRTDMTAFSGIVKDILGEIGTLKELFAEFEKRVKGSAEIRRTGLWKGIFS